MLNMDMCVCLKLTRVTHSQFLHCELMLEKWPRDNEEKKKKTEGVQNRNLRK